MVQERKRVWTATTALRCSMQSWTMGVRRRAMARVYVAWHGRVYAHRVKCAGLCTQGKVCGYAHRVKCAGSCTQGKVCVQHGMVYLKHKVSYTQGQEGQLSFKTRI